MKKQKAFTMIELLVVIAIISILSTILMVAIDPVGQSIKADDAKRIAMINQLQKALELYNLDHGHYPQMNVHTWHDGYHKTEFNSALAPYMKIDINDDLWGPNWEVEDPEFLYKTESSNGYQTYGLGIHLLHSSFHNYEVNDRGYWNTFYEVGQDPRYCIEHYSGGDASWWGGGSNRCVGGN